MDNILQKYKDIYFCYCPKSDVWYVSDMGNENIAISTLALYNPKMYRIDQCIEMFRNEFIKKIKQYMPPEFPEKPSQSKDTATTVTFNPNIPIVTSIYGYSLLKNGWVKNGNEYTKGEDKIIYDGTQWKFNGGIVSFMEDLGDKKIPE